MTGIGVITRDSDGFVLGGLFSFKDEVACARWVEGILLVTDWTG